MEDGIIADLGGDSLELAALRKGEVKQMISLPLGTMRLQAKMSGDMVKMKKEICATLDEIDWLGKYAGKTLFPIGGAWRAFARLKIKESGSPLDIIHGYTVPVDSAVETATLLMELPKKSLADLKNVVHQRRMSMPLTGLLLNELTDRTKPTTVTFSAVGVHEGYVYGNIPRDQIADDPLAAATSAFAERVARSFERLCQARNRKNSPRVSSGYSIRRPEI